VGEKRKGKIYNECTNAEASGHGGEEEDEPATEDEEEVVAETADSASARAVMARTCIWSAAM
jgi:hypothetical protein